MPADTLSSTEETEPLTAGAKKAAKAAVAGAMDSAQQRLEEAIDAAERKINDAVKRLEKVLREGLETFKTQAGPYRESAAQQIDEAQKYAVERIKERPVTATLAGLGVGLLLGMLLSGRSSK
jgi:ElaB/YqjD/DUF883 family membrane-anchored ribosome-binding protein